MKTSSNCRRLRVAACWLAALAAGAPLGAAGRLPVFVSIEPQAEFVERVGGGRVEVGVLVPAGASPATYEPGPRQLAALAGAKLYFRIGVPFENALLPKLESSMKGVRIVDTRQGITLRAMKGDESHASHEGACSHDGLDPHVWTSPRLVAVQARTIAAALADLDPAGKPVYDENCARFVEELVQLDRRLAASLAPVKGRTFMVFHPAWGYFADAYGLRQEPIEVEGKEPSARQLARIIDRARAEQVRVIFVQPQFSRAGAQAVAAAIGGAVVPIDPLARDYVPNLERVAAAVAGALEAQQ